MLTSVYTNHKVAIFFMNNNSVKATQRYTNLTKESFVNFHPGLQVSREKPITASACLLQKL